MLEFVVGKKDFTRSLKLVRADAKESHRKQRSH